MADGGFHQMIQFEPGPDTARQFRDALGRFATGVTVVTCQSPDGPLGMTVNSFTSLSMDPPLVLWSPARASGRFAAFEAADHFAIHILTKQQTSICNRFARDGYDFDKLDWTPAASGEPLIANCLARFECTRHAVHDGGDHAIIVGRVNAVTMQDEDPLVFAKGTFGLFAKRE